MALPKKKMCWNCEGRVSQEEENCSYCGVYLNGTSDFKGGYGENEEEEEMSASPAPLTSALKEEVLYPPLYQFKSSSAEVTETSTAKEEKARKVVLSEKGQKEEAQEKVEEKSFYWLFLSQVAKNEQLPLFLLLMGSFFLLFGLVLLLFSHEGSLVLRWNASLWFCYLAVGLPALIVGFRLLSRLPDDKE